MSFVINMLDISRYLFHCICSFLSIRQSLSSLVGVTRLCILKNRTSKHILNSIRLDWGQYFEKKYYLFAKCVQTGQFLETCYLAQMDNTFKKVTHPPIIIYKQNYKTLIIGVQKIHAKQGTLWSFDNCIKIRYMEWFYCIFDC